MGVSFRLFPPVDAGEFALGQCAQLTDFRQNLILLSGNCRFQSTNPLQHRTLQAPVQPKEQARHRNRFKGDGALDFLNRRCPFNRFLEMGVVEFVAARLAVMSWTGDHPVDV